MVTVHCVNDFLILYSLSSIKLLLFPNIYNNPVRQNNHLTAKPSITTKNCNLAQRINPKSTEKQLKNPTQNQDKPTENPTQNQSKLTGKPNQKTVQPHQKSQPKPYSTENSHEMPNRVGFAATAATRWSSIAAAESSIVVVSWGWEAKGRWWRKRGRGEGKREGESEREAESAEG